MSLDGVRRVADAVLYEGYILYPYRASAQKNRSRWQFGVLMPPGYAAANPCESSALRAECVFEHASQPTVEVTLRFLQVQRRHTSGPAPDAPGLETPAPRAPVLDAPVLDVPLLDSPVPDSPVLDAPMLTGAPSVWDEAVEREVTVASAGPALLGNGTVTQFTVPGGEDTETVAGARVVRRRAALAGSVSLHATPLPGPWQAARLTVQVTNESGDATAPAGTLRTRDEALPAALVAAHLIITLSGGAFFSMTDPPEWASPFVGGCDNTGCWPVLAGPSGDRQVMLAAPIILPDYPEIARESPGELYDGTEIDEILTLRTLALSDEEKAAARATDPRAAALIDRVDAMDAPTMEQLHGAIRGMRTVAPAGGPPGSPTGRRPPSGSAGWPPSGLAGCPASSLASGGEKVPWWDPGADESVSPGTDSVLVAGHRIARGSRVILRPGARRADAQDMFLAGRAALVEAVLLDVDDTAYLAVTLADDPAADLQSAHGRFRYFSPDEVEPDEASGIEPDGTEASETEASGTEASGTEHREADPSGPGEPGR